MIWLSQSTQSSSVSWSQPVPAQSLDLLLPLSCLTASPWSSGGDLSLELPTRSARENRWVGGCCQWLAINITYCPWAQATKITRWQMTLYRSLTTPHTYMILNNWHVRPIHQGLNFKHQLLQIGITSVKICFLYFRLSKISILLCPIHMNWFVSIPLFLAT